MVLIQREAGSGTGAHHAAHEHLDGPHVGLLQVHLALPGGQAGQSQRIAQLVLAGRLGTERCREF